MEKLIQLIGYREGFDKDKGLPYIYQKTFPNITITSIKSLFDNLEVIVSALPEGERFNVHYTNANCHHADKDKGLPLRSFAYQEMIPIDLDDIDLGKKDEYIKIVERVCKIDLKKTGIFCSGNGLHLVVIITQRIESVEELNRLQPYYAELCRKINIEIFEAGLSGNADPIRLAESATLRLPLTDNIKTGKKAHLPRTKSYVIQGHVEEQPFYLDKLVDLVEVTEEKKQLYKVDTKAVLAGCDFLKHCQSNPKLIKEPQWYALLGTLAYIPEIGNSLCHTYSEGHQDYDVEVTQSKIDQALGFGKPRTCQSVSQVFSGCVQCKYKDKVKTPLQIKGEDYIKTQFDGFHDHIETKSGIRSVPNYLDLLKFFQQQHTFVTNEKSRQVSIFNGTHWVTITDLYITSFATTHFMPQAKNSMRAEFLGLIHNTNLVDQDFFGKDNSGHVNFKNGVLRLSDKQLMPHSPDFGFIYVLPYDYNPHAKCPEFDKMMDNVTLKDESLKKILLEYVGYSISGMKASHGAKALILTGGGSNGKSTFLDVIKMLIGKECYSAVSLEDMANPNSRYSMTNKLFNICEEIEEKELRKGTAIFKSIVTGAELMVKKLYSDVVPMRIDAKLIISCNELPSSRENTYAIYRRMLIVPFRARFDAKTTGLDKGIVSRIEAEMSGVYNQVLEAYDRFMKNNGIFSNSIIAEQTLAEYKYNNSVYNQFSDACLEVGSAEDFLSNDELITAFNSWAQMNNVTYKPTTQQLIKELKVMGMIRSETTTKRVAGLTKRGYTGIKKINSGGF